MRPLNAHWLWPAAQRCGPSGPARLAQWLTLRRWLYKNRAARPLAPRAWRELVVGVWRMRTAFRSGDLASVIAAHGTAEDCAWTALREFRKASSDRANAKKTELLGKAPVDYIRKIAAEELAKGKKGYVKRTAELCGYSESYVSKLVNSPRN
jgi:hypothetical protein